MNTYKLIIGYDGTDYAGWQQQVDVPTITSTLIRTFAHAFGQPVSIKGASRTDAGVHALGQVALVTTPLIIEPEKLRAAWNNLLPSSMVIRTASVAHKDFHLYRDVRTKQYYYHFFCRRPLPFVARYGWHYPRPVDLDKLTAALTLFVGTHDFRSFCTGYERENTVRTVESVNVEYFKRFDVYRITVTGPGFLRHMIRRMVGAALKVASSDLPVTVITQALEQRNPRTVLPNAPACGLLLYKISYNTEHLA